MIILVVGMHRSGASLVARGHWLVKDPRSSLLIPLWREVAQRVGVELRVLRVIRPADDVPASLAVRNAVPREPAVRIRKDHQRSIDLDAAGLAVQAVRHDDLLREPQTAFTALGAFCGMPDAAERAVAAAGDSERALADLPTLVSPDRQRRRALRPDRVSSSPFTMTTVGLQSSWSGWSAGFMRPARGRP